MAMFEDRVDAGRRLADALVRHPAVQEAQHVVVLAIPRGGVPVGAEIAARLDAVLDVVVVRKLRSPANPELGVGAVAPDGYVDVDRALVERIGISEAQLEAEIAGRRAAVEERLAMYRQVVDAVDLAGAVVVVVDDGIATGGTARQACALARRQGAARVVLAAPVGPPGAEQSLADAADDVLLLDTPAEFMAVGQAYRDFDQLDDADALATLRAAQRA